MAQSFEISSKTWTGGQLPKHSVLALAKPKKLQYPMLLNGFPSSKGLDGKRSCISVRLRHKIQLSARHLFRCDTDVYRESQAGKKPSLQGTIEVAFKVVEKARTISRKCHSLAEFEPLVYITFCRWTLTAAIIFSWRTSRMESVHCWLSQVARPRRWVVWDLGFGPTYGC